MNDHQWTTITRLLFPMPRIRTDDFFTRKVMAKIDALEERRSAWKWALPVFGTGAACVLLVLSFITFNDPVSTNDLLLMNGGATEMVNVEELLDA